MNIYQFAMQMEKDGEEYYRQLARETTVPGLSKIFTMLADEEVKHYEVVERLSRKEKAPQQAESEILNNVKNIFIEMRAEGLEKNKQLHIDSTAASESCRNALVTEEDSEKFYREKAEQADDEHERQIFTRLAGEELNHQRIVGTLLEFVARPEPGNWLENAEWFHLEPY